MSHSLPMWLNEICLRFNNILWQYPPQRHGLELVRGHTWFLMHLPTASSVIRVLTPNPPERIMTHNLFRLNSGAA